MVSSASLNLYPCKKMEERKQSSAPGKASRPIKKLTRQQIKEGIDQFPVEVLLSAGPGKKADLTPRQREFARQLALAPSKAEAYRRSYSSKGKAKTIGDNAHRLSMDSRIQAERDAYALALEVEKHRTPAQLKSLLVQQLVQHTLDEDFPPAQRVQCLKLLGSLFEVGAFVERKEITTIKRSGDIRARILETLKDVTDIQALEIDDGLSLLDEIKGANETKAPHLADPTTPPPPQEGTPAAGATTHTIPREGIDGNMEDPPLDEIKG